MWSLCASLIPQTLNGILSQVHFGAWAIWKGPPSPTPSWNGASCWDTSGRIGVPWVVGLKKIYELLCPQIDGAGEPTSLGVRCQKHVGTGKWAGLNPGFVTFRCDLRRFHNFSESQIHNLSTYFIFVFNIGVGTQGLVRARQALSYRFVFNPFFIVFERAFQNAV